jgi:hypothetical protein
MQTANLGNPKQFASFFEEGKKEREEGEVEVYIEDIMEDGVGQDDMS